MHEHKTLKGLQIGDTLEEKLQILDDLGQKANDIHNKLPFKGDDARLWIYKAMWGAVIVYATTLRTFLYGDINQDGLLWILGVNTPEEALERQKGLMRSAKLTFNLETQFAIEAGLDVLLKAIVPGDKTGGFRDISKKILEKCGIADADKKADILYVPALMRNCLHNAGVHGKQTYPPIQIGAVTFDFAKEESVECIILESLVFAYTHGLDILTEIVSSAASLRFDSLLDPMKKYRAEQRAKAAAAAPAAPAAPGP